MWVACVDCARGDSRYAGVETNIIRSIPYCVITFVSFEFILRR